jgi:hypothetical protein
VDGERGVRVVDLGIWYGPRLTYIVEDVLGVGECRAWTALGRGSSSALTTRSNGCKSNSPMDSTPQIHNSDPPKLAHRSIPYTLPDPIPETNQATLPKP